jgi:basic membrane protein A|tara:strand:- start:5236 stop:6216 length:981 start_codon:yes stop_codon:yes gene_type:complete
MNFMKSILGSAAALAIGASAAVADPAIIFDLGGKFDKSFNETAFNGAQRWAEETGGSFREIELQTEAGREQALRRLAEAGSNPIVMTGFMFADVLSKVAPEYPDTRFGVIDVGWLDMPNLRQYIFNEHEGSYLVGMLAAMASETGTVGFVGGQDIGLIRRFGCGYAQGVLAVNPNASIIANMTGTTGAAWNDPVKGGELTKAQISQGADVVFAAAGGTGIGVLQTAADEGILSIGVDMNQNHLQPGSVLTTMLKRVDNAVYDAFKGNGDWAGTMQGVVGYAMDEHNASLVTADMQAKVNAAEASIKSGTLSVHDYMSDDSCPVLSF